MMPESARRFSDDIMLNLLRAITMSSVDATELIVI